MFENVSFDYSKLLIFEKFSLCTFKWSAGKMMEKLSSLPGLLELDETNAFIFKVYSKLWVMFCTFIVFSKELMNFLDVHSKEKKYQFYVYYVCLL
jgi:hypothetical protein